MAAHQDDIAHLDESPAERSARYWKKAANMYHQACTSEAPEVRAMRMEMMMAWAAMATELERAPVTLAQDAQGDQARH